MDTDSLPTQPIDLTSPPSPGRVLVAAGPNRSVQIVAQCLEHTGYDITMATSGDLAVAQHLHTPADVIVLDVTCPAVDAMTVTRRLRALRVQTPIMLIGPTATASERASGLDAGADDYLSIPIHPSEAAARVRAVLRRSAPSHDSVQIGDLRIDVRSRRAWRADEELHLTRTEFDLLELLARNCGVVVSHATLSERVWGYTFQSGSKNLAVFIGYLRRKTEDHGRSRLVHTVRGVGYTLRP